MDGLVTFSWAVLICSTRQSKGTTVYLTGYTGSVKESKFQANLLIKNFFQAYLFHFCHCFFIDNFFGLIVRIKKKQKPFTKSICLSLFFYFQNDLEDFCTSSQKSTGICHGQLCGQHFLFNCASACGPIH